MPPNIIQKRGFVRLFKLEQYLTIKTGPIMRNYTDMV